MVFWVTFWSYQDFCREDLFLIDFCWMENDWSFARQEVDWYRYQVCSMTRISSNWLSKSSREVVISIVFFVKILTWWYHRLLLYFSQLDSTDFTLIEIILEDCYWKFTIFPPSFWDWHMYFRYAVAIVLHLSFGIYCLSRKAKILQVEIQKFYL